jgi:hypothetical protein
MRCIASLMRRDESFKREAVKMINNQARRSDQRE